LILLSRVCLAFVLHFVSTSTWHFTLHTLLAVLAGPLTTPDLNASRLSQEYSTHVETVLIETLRDGVYTNPNVDRAVTEMSDREYLKMLLTTAGHSEKWANKNLDRVIWLLKCVNLGGVDSSPAQSFSLANVNDAILQRAVDQHRDVHDYGQYLREAMRHGKGSTLKYPSKGAAEVLLCFLVRKKFQLEEEEEEEEETGVEVGHAADEAISAEKPGSRDYKEMEYVHEELKKLGEISGDDAVIDALLQEAAKARRLRIEEMPWKSTKGSEDEEDKAMRNFGFIFMAYRPSCWWFELFEMVRKLMMVGVRMGLGFRDTFYLRWSASSSRWGRSCQCSSM
jgi:hypothetical protein